jgi:hypothetical protein
MRFDCALFIVAVVGIACGIIAALSYLFWHTRTPRELEPHEKQLVSNWRRLKKAAR